MYIYYYIMSHQRSSLPLPVYRCPYHTKMNKSLVLEWPTFIDVYSYFLSPTGVCIHTVCYRGGGDRVVWRAYTGVIQCI
jgi:hypothetical protein